MPILVFFNIFIYLEKEVSLISMQERGVTPTGACYKYRCVITIPRTLQRQEPADGREAQSPVAPSLQASLSGVLIAPESTEKMLKLHST